MLQLNPSIPVIVTSKENREGEAMFLHVRSPEHHFYWGVVFDDTGEVWWVPNNEIRVMNCWTVGRPPRKSSQLRPAKACYKHAELTELLHVLRKNNIDPEKISRDTLLWTLAETLKGQ